MEYSFYFFLGWGSLSLGKRQGAIRGEVPEVRRVCAAYLPLGVELRAPKPGAAAILSVLLDEGWVFNGSSK